MEEAKYWNVTVQLEIENGNGRVQKVKENYLVSAVSATDAEQKIYIEFEVVGAVKSKIIKVLE